MVHPSFGFKEIQGSQAQSSDRQRVRASHQAFIFKKFLAPPKSHSFMSHCGTIMYFLRERDLQPVRLNSFLILKPLQSSP